VRLLRHAVEHLVVIEQHDHRPAWGNPQQRTVVRPTAPAEAYAAPVDGQPGDDHDVGQCQRRGTQRRPGGFTQPEWGIPQPAPPRVVCPVEIQIGAQLRQQHPDVASLQSLAQGFGARFGADGDVGSDRRCARHLRQGEQMVTQGQTGCRALRRVQRATGSQQLCTKLFLSRSHHGSIAKSGRGGPAQGGRGDAHVPGSSWRDRCARALLWVADRLAAGAQRLSPAAEPPAAPSGTPEQTELDALTARAVAVAPGALRADPAPAERGDERVDHLADLAAIEPSREFMRGNLTRIGEALASTLDLQALLGVVLDTAVAGVGAERAVILLAEPGGHLRLRAVHGLRERGLPTPDAVPLGAGVLGGVALRGEPLRGRLGSGPADLAPTSGEPDSGDVLAAPLRRRSAGGAPGAVAGVLALYDRPDGLAYSERDEETLSTLADQASVAVDNVLLHREAQRQSITDPLTGLGNFRHLTLSLAREIERATRFQRPLAVLMFDLDRFKEVNDTHGHARGDEVLRELAHRVTEQIREVDTLARYGGEEFVLVLPETTAEGAALVAERVCTEVRREPFTAKQSCDGPPLTITVSVGGASFPVDGTSPSMLMRAADQALYVAKRAGRDRWHVPTG
jgi:diguanylate cyclase (GGDEF)-like protein